MRSFVKIVIGFGFIACVNLVQGQERPNDQNSQLVLEVQQTKSALSGKTMMQIESMFGAPSQKLPAVGQPPITRWQYANQTVYFEQDRVIHSVQHNQ